MQVYKDNGKYTIKQILFMVPFKKPSKTLISKNLSLGSEIFKMTFSPLIRVTGQLPIGPHSQNTSMLS